MNICKQGEREREKEKEREKERKKERGERERRERWEIFKICHEISDGFILGFYGY